MDFRENQLRTIHMTDQQIVSYLNRKFGNGIKETIPFPKPFVKEMNQVKAIYLGCDPSNSRSDTFDYAFALEGTNPLYNQFILSHEKNLNAVVLKWKELYVQNLCQNYFQKETSKNLKLWKQVAREFWIEQLNKELRIFPASIPVLLTAQYLLEVLAIDGYEKIPAIDFYECKNPIPVPADKNLLGRTLIPFYRGINPKLKKSYNLSTGHWSDYREQVRKLVL